MTLTTGMLRGVGSVLACCALASGCGSSQGEHQGGTGGSAGSANGQGGAAGVRGGSAGSMNQSGASGTSNAGGGGASGAGRAGSAGRAGKGGTGAGDAGRGGTTGGDTGQGGNHGGSPSAGSESGGSPAAGEAGAGGAAPSCMDLQTQYADELTKAKACDPSASTPQCQVAVPAPLGCNTCAYIVNDATTLFAIKAAYEDQNCQAHFCPSVVCMATELGLCMGSGSEGACLDRQP